jgi:hypothetical protein
MISIEGVAELSRRRKSAIERVDGFDWLGIARDLDQQGNAVVEQLLSPEECRAIAGLYSNDDIFRSRVVMERHGFGRGEYKYFRYPLPHLLSELRTAVYPHLVPVANRWNEAMGIDVRLATYAAACTPRRILFSYKKRAKGCKRIPRKTLLGGHSPVGVSSYEKPYDKYSEPEVS